MTKFMSLVLAIALIATSGCMASGRNAWDSRQPGTQEWRDRNRDRRSGSDRERAREREHDHTEQPGDHPGAP